MDIRVPSPANSRELEGGGIAPKNVLPERTEGCRRMVRAIDSG